MPRWIGGEEAFPLAQQQGIDGQLGADEEGVDLTAQGVELFL